MNKVTYVVSLDNDIKLETLDLDYAMNKYNSLPLGKRKIIKQEVIKKD